MLRTLQVSLWVWLPNPQGLLEPSLQLYFPVSFCLENPPLWTALSIFWMKPMQHVSVPAFAGSPFCLPFFFLIPPHGSNSVSLSQRTFSNSHCPNTQPPHQPLQLHLSCYNCYAPQRASRAETAPLRTWCDCENVQVCAHAHDDFQGELTSQNFQPKKCTDISVHYSLFKILVVFPDFLNQVLIA